MASLKALIKISRSRRHHQVLETPDDCPLAGMTLPEVVPDPSLEAMQASHTQYQHGWDHGEKDPKYTVVAGDYKSDPNAPSVHYDAGLIPVHSVHSFKIDDTGHLVPPGGAGSSRGRKTICGLRPKIFWLLLGIGLVVVIASVAGGVGGGMMAARSRKENAQASGTSPIAVDNSSSTATTTKKPHPSGTGAGGASDGGKSTDGPANSADASSPEGNASGKATGTDTSKAAATATGTPTDTSHETASSPAQKTVTTGTTVVSTTTKQHASTPTTAPGTTTSKAAAATTTTKTPVSAAPAPEATFLNNQTYSLTGFAFQAFSGSDYTGKVSDVIRDEGFLDLSFSSNSYVWLPNGADCCITFCSDDTTAVGWWCDERRQKDSSSTFPRVWIGCGSAAHQEHACS